MKKPCFDRFSRSQKQNRKLENSTAFFFGAKNKADFQHFKRHFRYFGDQQSFREQDLFCKEQLQFINN